MDVSRGRQAHLSVSIVLFNSPLELLWRTLHSLQAAALAARAAGSLHRVSVYLVDNASDARYRTLLEEQLAGWPHSPFVSVRCSWLSRNRGFGAGHNTTLAHLASDFHLVLNPDVELEDSALQAGLVTLQQNDNIALLSPV